MVIFTPDFLSFLENLLNKILFKENVVSRTRNVILQNFNLKVFKVYFNFNNFVNLDKKLKKRLISRFMDIFIFYKALKDLNINYFFILGYLLNSTKLILVH